MTAPLLSISGLRKAFGAVVACDDVDLQIEPGEIHAIIGPNGAGKSTLIGQIAGEIQPDAGAIRFAGEDITHFPVHVRAALGLGRSFQITSVLPRFTARHNVALSAQAHDGHSFRFWQPASEDRRLCDAADHALIRVGLAERAEVPAAELAHGEQRQLELAMALAGQPRLLLLDEPMAGTGHEESAKIVELLARLRAETTILLIEHDMDAVFKLADRITVLVYGRVIATGTPDEIRRHPEARRAYLGEENA